MILIADSGSTKTKWALIQNKKTIGSYLTEGINPFFRQPDDLLDELKQKLLPLIPGMVRQVHFYGAGIINNEKGEAVIHVLQEIFPEAKMNAFSDLLAAARASCGSRKGIVCILGTGSNSCLYDGIKIVDHVSPLGFILGDEGSGAVLGKKLVSDYLKGVMPENLRENFISDFKPVTPEILESVYRRERPNLFLAKFTHFISEHIGSSYCQSLVKNEFELFVDRNLMKYDGIDSLPVHFVGSVAAVFQDILIETVRSRSLNPGRVIRDPMEGLIKFHTNA